MSSSKPPWWRAFDRLERRVGRPLEELAESSRYVDVMLRGMRAQRAVGGALGKLVGGAAEKVLRTAHIPTRSDVRRLNHQLAVLTNEVRSLSADHQEMLAQARRLRPPASSAMKAPPTERRSKTPGRQPRAQRPSAPGDDAD